MVLLRVVAGAESCKCGGTGRALVPAECWWCWFLRAVDGVQVLRLRVGRGVERDVPGLDNGC